MTFNRIKWQKDYNKKHKKRKLEYQHNYYLNHKKKIKKYNKKYFKGNRKKINKLVMKNYKKNKKKWYCRNRTRLILKGKKIYIEYKCKKCPIIWNLQIHHEVYPTKDEEVIQAIKEGKIYFLCRKHHTKKIK